MDNVEQLLRDLIAIDSINPDLVPGAAGEGAIARFIADWLRAAGLEVHLIEALPGRPSVVGIARGRGGGRTLMLNGHIDTVGVTGMDAPFAPVVEGRRMYGRGSYDMKGGLAACMVTAAAAARRNLRGDLIITAVADEEYAGLGTITVAEQFQADGAIVAEPTELELVVAHKGFVWLDVETQGVPAHGSRPHLGVDAIVKMGGVLAELERLGHDLAAGPRHPLLGPASVHAGLIEGGQEISSYPARCVLSVERRTLPGETPETAGAELQGIVNRLAAADPAFKGVVRRGIDRVPLETPHDADIVTALRDAAARQLGRPCELTGVSFWTDAASLWARGIPTVLFGPLGEGAHAAVEWVDLDSVQACADIYLAVAEQFCA